MLNTKGGLLFKALNALFVLVFAVLVVSSIFSVTIGKQKPYIVAVAEGRVAVFDPLTNVVKKASVGDELKRDDMIETDKKSSAELQLQDEVTLRLGEKTKVNFRKPESLRWNWASARVHLEWGELMIDKVDAGFRKAVQVTVPGQTKQVNRAGVVAEINVPLFVLEAYSSKFEIQRSRDQMQAVIHVLRGDVKVRSSAKDGEFVMLRGGQSLTVGEDMLLNPSGEIKSHETSEVKNISHNASSQKGTDILRLIHWNKGFFSDNGSFSRVLAQDTAQVEFMLEAGPSKAGIEFFLEEPFSLKGYNGIELILANVDQKPMPAFLLLELMDQQKVFRRFKIKTSDGLPANFPLNPAGQANLTSFRLSVQTGASANQWTGACRIEAFTLLSE